MLAKSIIIRYGSNVLYRNLARLQRNNKIKRNEGNQNQLKKYQCQKYFMKPKVYMHGDGK
jgi:hypothetical protein